MKFYPVSNYILVKPIQVSNTTASGLALPESALDKPNKGTVIEIGSGQLTPDGVVLPISVNVNDTILFPKYAGIDITINNEKYLIMRDTDVFGIVVNESI